MGGNAGGGTGGAGGPSPGGTGYGGDKGAQGTAGEMSGGAGGAGMAGYGGGGLAGVKGSGWGGPGGSAGRQAGVLGQGSSFGTAQMAPGYSHNPVTGQISLSNPVLARESGSAPPPGYYATPVRPSTPPAVAPPPAAPPAVAPPGSFRNPIGDALDQNLGYADPGVRSRMASGYTSGAWGPGYSGRPSTIGSQSNQMGGRSTIGRNNMGGNGIGGNFGANRGPAGNFGGNRGMGGISGGGGPR
jgi:hypothetical protein